VTIHILRPRCWAEQVVLLLSTLQDGDELQATDTPMKLAIEAMLRQWGVKTPITVADPPVGQILTCIRCGSHVFGSFCDTCAGTLHKQDCPKLWPANLDVTESFVEQLIDKGYAGRPGDPCNCGGDELEHSIGHATDLLRL